MCLKIKDYKSAVIGRLERKLEEVSKTVSESEESAGFAYEMACDAELIGNILKVAEATTENMNEHLYKGIQFSLSKNFKAVCVQAPALNEKKAYTKGRKNSVVFCKQVCKKEWKE